MEVPSPVRVLAATGATALALVVASTAPDAGQVTGQVTTQSSGHLVVGGAHPASYAAVSARRGHRRTGSRTTRRWAGSVRVSDRTAVTSAYLRSFAPGLRLATGYTGSDADCRPGTTSAASRAATLAAVNFARSMSGLAPVQFSPGLNARAQRTALMMSANGTLSHAPSHAWRCWTADGAANAGRSDLALSYPAITSSGLVDLYLREPGAENTAAGHRRWLLNPFATVMGSGSTDTANALTVIGPTDPRRPDPAWVAWPTAGYFPTTLEPDGLWSLSAGDRRTDFRRASVQVSRNGVAVRVVRRRVQDGYGQPTLVWQVPAAASDRASASTYRVVVRGVRRSGSRRVLAHSYDVHLFTPAG